MERSSARGRRIWWSDRRRPSGRRPERVHGGSRVAPRVHVDLDEVLALELAPVGRRRHHVARCSLRREEPEQAKEAHGAGVELDGPNVAVVQMYLKAVDLIRDDPQPHDDVWMRTEEVDRRREMRPFIKERAGLTAPEPTVLPERELEHGPHGAVLPPFAFGPGAVTKAWISHGMPWT